MADPRNKVKLDKVARQENLREVLSKQKHVEHVIDLAGKIETLGIEIRDTDMEGGEVTRKKASIEAFKVVIDTKMKLVNKYLGDVKTVEHTGEVKQTVIDDRNQLETILKERGVDPESIRLQ